MDTTPLDDLLAHWRSLPIADGAKVPAKSSLSPTALKPHLPHIGIFERVGRYDMQVRLFGTQLDEKFGQILTGQNLFDFYAKETFEFYADFYEAALDTPAGCRIWHEGTDANDNIIRGESLVLPMADNDGVARFIVPIVALEAESALNDPLDTARLHLAKVTGTEYFDIGYSLPANKPVFPTL